MMATRITLQRSFHLQSFRVGAISGRRLQSTVVQAQQEVRATRELVDPEWANAKPYRSIPTPTVMQLIKGFNKGGRYADLSLPEVYKRWREDFGDLIRVRRWMGRPDIVISFSPEDYQKLFRTEGVWPFRRALETIT